MKNLQGYQSSNHTASAGGMALVSDGEVVVFDDIDDNWTQNLRLDLPNINAPAALPPTSMVDDDDDDLLLQHQQQQLLQQQLQQQHQAKSPPEPLSSSLCSSPSPTTTYHRNATDFFKVWFLLNCLFTFFFYLKSLTLSRVFVT